MLRFRWPRGERNLARKLRFRLTGGVEVWGIGGLEDMTHSRDLLHPYKMAGLVNMEGERRSEARGPAGHGRRQ